MPPPGDSAPSRRDSGLVKRNEHSSLSSVPVLYNIITLTLPGPIQHLGGRAARAVPGGWATSQGRLHVSSERRGPFSSAPVQRVRSYLSWGLAPERSCHGGLGREAGGRSCQKLWLGANQLAAEPKAPASPQTSFVSLGLPFSAASPQVIVVGTPQLPGSFSFCVSDHFTRVN